MSHHMSNSRFNMWRCLVSLVYTDHKLTIEERKFFTDRFEKLNLSEEQKSILLQELQSPQKIENIFKYVTDKEDRATFIYFARLLFWSDGEFAEQEEKILKHLHSQVTSEIDIKQVMQDVNDATKEIMARYDREIKAKKEDSGLWSALKFAITSGLWPARDLD